MSIIPPRELQWEDPAPSLTDPVSPTPFTPPSFQLTATQEMDLLLYPESQHARIIGVLIKAPSSTTAWDSPPVTTVAQAVAYLKRTEDTDASIKDAPVTGAALDTVVIPNAITHITEQLTGNAGVKPAEPEPAPIAEVAVEVEVGPPKPSRADQYNEYIEACRQRRTRIMELRALIKDRKIGTSEYDLWAERTRAECETYLKAYAKEQRELCEAYIATQLSKVGYVSGVEALKMELKSLVENVPQREDYMR